MYIKRQTFLVFGLSRSGKAAAEFLLGKGARVYLYDDLTGERVEQVAAALAEKGAKRLKSEEIGGIVDRCDALVLSPGIPIDHPTAVAFKRAGKAVLGEAELAAIFMRCPLLAVTGTNGKTTVVSMLTDVLQRGRYAAKACGNIGLPMIDFHEMTENEVAVAEISSFQMETLNSLRPHVALVLNITEDHLNRHYSMENYVFLKAKFLKNLTETEYAVLNYDDPIVRGFAEKTKAQVLYFSVRERVRGAYFEEGILYFGKEKILSVSELPAEGLHTVQNALAVIVAAKIMGVKTADIVAALKAFKGIKHRIEFVREVNGVRYVDDSKGTNIAATLKAVESMKTPTVLLLGGKNKGYDYKPLFAALLESRVVHAVLYGENRYALLKSARACGFDKITLCEGFAFAVQVAAMKAEKGQTVLLSPASASFDEFASYEERGDTFVQIVRALAQEENRMRESVEESVVENERALPTSGNEGDGGSVDQPATATGGSSVVSNFAADRREEETE